MANTIFQLRRSSVAGKTPNTTTLTIGELGINLTDQKLYSSNGTVVFEIGSNLVNLSVTNTISVTSISANGGLGSTGQVLTTDGANVYWSTVSSAPTGVREQFTGNGTNTVFTVSGGYSPTQLDVFVNGVKLYNGTEVDVSNGSIITFATAPRSGMLIEVVGTTSISNPSNYLKNTYSGTLSGNLTFSNTVAFSNTVTINALSANGGVGSNGQVLTSNGSTAYWSTLIGVNTDSQYTFTNTITFSNTVSFGSNITANDTTIFLGNSTVNTSISANLITLNGSNVVTFDTAMKVYYANGTQAFP